MLPSYAEIFQALRPFGLIVRGGFTAEPNDELPSLDDGRPAACVVLVGNTGSDMWHVFKESPESNDGQPRPLDRWTERILGDMVVGWKGSVAFPFGGPPYLPFLRWAARCEALHPSPLGMLIHPEHGLWHAYRGALLFAEVVEVPEPAASPHPCESCKERPCLSVCPVSAFSEGPDGSTDYDAERCRAHLHTPSGRDCSTGGCLARRACPVSRNLAYDAEHAAFHMRSFARV